MPLILKTPCPPGRWVSNERNCTRGVCSIISICCDLMAKCRAPAGHPYPISEADSSDKKQEGSGREVANCLLRDYFVGGGHLLVCLTYVSLPTSETGASSHFLPI